MKNKYIYIVALVLILLSFGIIPYFIPDIKLHMPRLVKVSEINGHIIKTKDSITSKITDIKLNVGKSLLNKHEKISIVAFDLGKFEITIINKDRLLKEITPLCKNKAYTIDVMGFTDTAGTESQNVVLSIKRSREVVEFLIANGCNNTTYVGYSSANNKREVLVTIKY